MFVSIGFFSFFLNSMTRSDLFYLKDNISTSSRIFDLMKPHDSELMVDENGEKRFDMIFYINNKDFDNDDNPYGKFIFHQYTNMEGPDDITGKTENFNDVEIPIEECEAQEADWRNKKIKYYCPKFNESHYLHGGWIADKYSYLKLILHICDNSGYAREQRRIEGRTHIDCATREESLWYFENNVIGVETLAK